MAGMYCRMKGCAWMLTRGGTGTADHKEEQLMEVEAIKSIFFDEYEGARGDGMAACRMAHGGRVSMRRAELSSDPMSFQLTLKSEDSFDPDARYVTKCTHSESLCMLPNGPLDAHAGRRDRHRRLLP